MNVWLADAMVAAADAGSGAPDADTGDRAVAAYVAAATPVSAGPTVGGNVRLPGQSRKVSVLG